MLLIIREMAREPHTAKQAAARATHIMPDTEAVRQSLNGFWRLYLADNPGSSSPGYSPPSPPSAHYIDLQQTAGQPYIRLQSTATFRLRPGLLLTAILTSLDTPGIYRLDLVAQGIKPLQARQVLDTSAQLLRMSQDAAAKSGVQQRIQSSTARQPHTNKPGKRDQDKLVGRAIFGRVPLEALVHRAGELRAWTKSVGDMLLALSPKENPGG